MIQAVLEFRILFFILFSWQSDSTPHRIVCGCMKKGLAVTRDFDFSSWLAVRLNAAWADKLQMASLIYYAVLEI